MADKSIALTISHNLSGSYNAALAARDTLHTVSAERLYTELDACCWPRGRADAGAAVQQGADAGPDGSGICLRHPPVRWAVRSI